MFNFQTYSILFLTIQMLTQIYEISSNIAVEKTNRKQLKSKDKILFSIEPIKNLTVTIPQECEDLGICEYVPGYPQNLISSLIKNLLQQNITFHMDVDPSDEYTNVTHRFLEMYEEEELCKSKPKLYYPQAARDASQKWHLILNSAETSQNFIGEHCASMHSKCNKVAFFTNLYHGVCVQKYMQRVMYGLNEELNRVIKTLFDVPSCCSCIARRS